MSGGEDVEVIQGQRPTREDLFYVGWAEETLKGNLARVSDTLGRLMALSAALLGGSITLAGAKLLADLPVRAAMFCFLVALIAALLGSFLREGLVDPRRPDQIREHKDRILQSRRNYALASSLAVLAGLLAAMVAVLFG
jgi:hypothetical protein